MRLRRAILKSAVRTFWSVLMAMLLLVPTAAQSHRELLDHLEKVEGKKRLAVLTTLVTLARKKPVENALAHGREALELLEEHPDDLVESHVRSCMAVILSRGGDFVEAREHANVAVDTCEKSGNRQHLSVALWSRSYVARQSGRFGDALADAKRAHEIATALNDRMTRLSTLVLLSEISHDREDHVGYIDYNRRALDIAEALDDEVLQAGCKVNIANGYRLIGELEKALDGFLEVLGRIRERGMTSDLAVLLVHLSNAYSGLGRPEEAVQPAMESLEIFDGLGDEKGVAVSYDALGTAYSALEEDEQALSHFRKALTAGQRLGGVEFVAEVLRKLAVLHARAENFDKAVATLRRGLLLAERNGNERVISGIQQTMGDVLTQCEEFEEASEAYARHIELASHLKDTRTAERLIELEAARALSKAELEVEDLEADGRRKEVRLSQQRDRIFQLILGTALLVVTVAGLLLSSRTRRRTLATVRRNHAQLEAASERLAESERRFRSAFDDARSPRLLIDLERGLVLEANAAAMALFASSGGAPPSPPLSMNLLKPQWLRDALTELDDVTQDEHRYSAEWKDISGATHQTEIRCSRLSLDGNPGALLSIYDVTEDRRLEEERSRRDKLESLGVLAGGIAHDFNNSLGAISGLISLARLDADEDVGMVLGDAEKAVRQASHLTGQLLAFSKGGEPLRKIHDLKRLIRDAVRFALSGSSTRAEFDLRADLWSAEVDGAQIQQAISNIVMNADQAMEHAGRLTVTAENGHGTTDGISAPIVTIRISDEGPGIPAKLREKIMDPYFTTKDGGSGLGLATAFAVVRRHGGELEFESDARDGTTFIMRIPAAPGAKPAKLGADPAGRKSSGRVLVLEDEEILQRVYREGLERLGYEVVVHGDGRQTIEAYRRVLDTPARFDVVILDLTISGGLGGKATMEELRRIDSAVKGIVISGYSSDPVMSRYRSAGFVAALEKPFMLQELDRVISRILARDENATNV